MAFEATIIKDSVFRNGVRVTTARLSFPRSILAEFNTHRMFSRNAASSRAIPVAKMIAKIENDPFIPEFKKNAKGMQGVEPLDTHGELAKEFARGKLRELGERCMDLRSETHAHYWNCGCSVNFL